MDLDAFRKALPGLLQTARGLYVAVAGGRIVDRDADEFALVNRLARQRPGQRILIQRVVEDGLEDVHVDTPEFELPKQRRA